jgi:hypothetical protein
MTGTGWRNSIASIALVAAGCASTPQASPERDAEAKKFLTDPRSATVYVYRLALENDGGDRSDSVLYVDERLIGSTLPGTFFLLRLRTGVHTLSGYAHDQGRFDLEVRAGQLYFVWLQVIGGESLFSPVSMEAGKRELLACCVLLENWAPGQRPLLR